MSKRGSNRLSSPPFRGGACLDISSDDRYNMRDGGAGLSETTRLVVLETVLLIIVAEHSVLVSCMVSREALKHSVFALTCFTCSRYHRCGESSRAAKSGLTILEELSGLQVLSAGCGSKPGLDGNSLLPWNLKDTCLRRTAG